MILLLFVDSKVDNKILSFLKKGQNENEHMPQDRIKKTSHGIDSLSFIKHGIHFHNDRFYYLGSFPI
jgi:hypothetical protein